MPGTRKEAGVIALIGVLVAVFGSTSAGSPALVLIGVAAAVIGAVLWLIHYSADLRKAKS